MKLITHPRLLANDLAESCKDETAFRIGIELEKFVCLRGSQRPLPYRGSTSIHTLLEELQQCLWGALDPGSRYRLHRTCKTRIETPQPQKYFRSWRRGVSETTGTCDSHRQKPRGTKPGALLPQPPFGRTGNQRSWSDRRFVMNQSDRYRQAKTPEDPPEELPDDAPEEIPAEPEPFGIPPRQPDESPAQPPPEVPPGNPPQEIPGQ